MQVPRSPKEKMQMSKWKNKPVCQLFEGVRHHGLIKDIVYHDVHAQYMYRVVYDDDDIDDYWRHELEMILCRCEHTEDWSLLNKYNSLSV